MGLSRAAAAQKLGVHVSDTDAAIRKGYRRIALSCHPDSDEPRGPDQARHARARFRQVRHTLRALLLRPCAALMPALCCRSGRVAQAGLAYQRLCPECRGLETSDSEDSEEEGDAGISAVFNAAMQSELDSLRQFCAHSVDAVLGGASANRDWVGCFKKLDAAGICGEDAPASSRGANGHGRAAANARAAYEIYDSPSSSASSDADAADDADDANEQSSGDERDASESDCASMPGLEDVGGAGDHGQRGAGQEWPAVSVEEHEEELELLQDELDRFDEEFQAAQKGARARDSAVAQEFERQRKEFERQRMQLLCKIKLVTRKRNKLLAASGKDDAADTSMHGAQRAADEAMREILMAEERAASSARAKGKRGTKVPQAASAPAGAAGADVAGADAAADIQTDTRGDAPLDGHAADVGVGGGGVSSEVGGASAAGDEVENGERKKLTKGEKKALKEAARAEQQRQKKADKRYLQRQRRKEERDAGRDVEREELRANLDLTSAFAASALKAADKPKPGANSSSKIAALRAPAPRGAAQDMEQRSTAPETQHSQNPKDGSGGAAGKAVGQTGTAAGRRKAEKAHGGVEKEAQDAVLAEVENVQSGREVCGVDKDELKQALLDMGFAADAVLGTLDQTSTLTQAVELLLESHASQEVAPHATSPSPAAAPQSRSESGAQGAAGAGEGGRGGDEAQGSGGHVAAGADGRACEATEGYILEQIAVRQAAREAGDFVKADAILHALSQQGILLQDYGKRTVFKRLSPQPPQPEAPAPVSSPSVRGTVTPAAAPATSHAPPSSTSDTARTSSHVDVTSHEPAQPASVLKPSLAPTRGAPPRANLPRPTTDVSPSDPALHLPADGDGGGGGGGSSSSSSGGGSESSAQAKGPHSAGSSADANYTQGGCTVEFGNVGREVRHSDLREALLPYGQVLGHIKFVGVGKGAVCHCAHHMCCACDMC